MREESQKFIAFREQVWREQVWREQVWRYGGMEGIGKKYFGKYEMHPSQVYLQPYKPGLL